MAILTIHSADELQEYISQARKIVVLFSAKWCNPCQRFYPQYERLAQSYPGIVFAYLDIDQALENASDEVSTVPTLKYYSNGKYVTETYGADPDAVERALSNLF